MTPVLVLHTTEGTSIAGAVAAMKRAGSTSNYITDPKVGGFEKLSNRGRSLRNMTGGVETNNRGGVIQVEVVGYAGNVAGYPRTWYASLADTVRAICELHDIPIEMPYPFGGESAYGLNGSHRLTNKQWLEVGGIVGHQHVPENSHWDPGPIHIKLAPALGITVGASTTKGTTTMEYNPIVQDWQEIIVNQQEPSLGNGWADGKFGPGTFERSVAHLTAEREAKDRAHQRILSLEQRIKELERQVETISGGGGVLDPTVDRLAQLGRITENYFNQAAPLINEVG